MELLGFGHDIVCHVKYQHAFVEGYLFKNMIGLDGTQFSASLDLRKVWAGNNGMDSGLCYGLKAYM